MSSSAHDNKNKKEEAKQDNIDSSAKKTKSKDGNI